MMVIERSMCESPEQRAVEQVVPVVDDDEDLADTCRYWLDGEWFAVKTVYGGEEILHRLDDIVDVVPLDRRMPNVMGDDVFEEICERDLDCRVAMMTAVEPGTGIAEMPFDVYLVRPVSESEIKKTVEELLVRSEFESGVHEYFALEPTEAALDSRDVEELREPEALSDLRSRLEMVWAKYEVAIRNREAQLDRLNRTNELLRDVNRALIDTRTHDEIEQTVCDVVADAHEAVAVLRRIAAGTLRYIAAAGHGLDPAGVDLDFIDEAFGVDGAAENGFVFEDIPGAHRAVILGDDADDPDAVSALCVSIDYRETMHGVLVVYDETDDFDDESAGLFSDLGATVGNGTNAAQSKRLLNGGSVVELELQVGCGAGALVRLSAALDYQPSLDGVTRLDDDLACFISVAGALGYDAVATAIDAVDVSQARVAADGDEESVVELRTDVEAVLSTAIDHGASVGRSTLSGGSSTLTLHVAADVDHGTLVEAVTTAAAGVSVVAKREAERSAQSADSFRRALDSKLTDRQRTVFETSPVSGYFEWSRGGTTEEVAGSLGISPPTLHEHLRAAERKLIETYLDELNQASADD